MVNQIKRLYTREMFPTQDPLELLQRAKSFGSKFTTVKIEDFEFKKLISESESG